MLGVQGGVKGINAPTAAHIHEGRSGVAGPVVIPFGAACKTRGARLKNLIEPSRRTRIPIAVSITARSTREARLSAVSSLPGWTVDELAGRRRGRACPAALLLSEGEGVAFDAWREAELEEPALQVREARERIQAGET